MAKYIYLKAKIMYFLGNSYNIYSFLFGDFSKSL